MSLFWCGVLVGGVSVFMATIAIAVQADDEKDNEIHYLRRRLAEQAEAERKKAQKREVFKLDDQRSD